MLPVWPYAKSQADEVERRNRRGAKKGGKGETRRGGGKPAKNK